MEEIKEPVPPVEKTDEETVTEPLSEESQAEETGEETGETTEADKSAEVDYQQKYESLEKEVKQLRNFIRTKQEDGEDETEPELAITKDAKEFLSDFAEKPQEILKTVIDNAINPYKKSLLGIQQQQAIDYIHSQKDFDEKMYDELLYIVEGADRNRWFNIEGQMVKLKNLPPRQKAEAALQIHRANKQSTNNSTRLKPVTTTKAKSTMKSGAKADEMLSAVEFAQKYSIKQGAM